MGKRRRRGTAELSCVSAGVAMVGVVLLAAVSIGFVVATVLTWHENRGMTAARICELSEPRDGCLRPVDGFVSGPRYSRGPGSDWRFEPVAVSGISHSSTVEVSTANSRRLENTAYVDGLYWRGDLVAFRDRSDGTVIESLEFGDQGWLMLLFAALFVTSTTIMYGLVARNKRSLAGDWWSRPRKVPIARMVKEEDSTLFAPLFVAGTAGFFALAFGASPTVASIVSATLTGGVVLVVLGAARLRDSR